MEKINESYDDYKDLDELDDLDNYRLVYQVKIVGYNDLDEETDYNKTVATFEDYNLAQLKADSIQKDEIEDLSEDDFYVRINIEPVILGNDFSEYQELEYSRIIIIK